MKQLLNSSFVICCMGVLVILGVINTCQINHLEEGMIANRKAIGQLSKGGIAVQTAERSGTDGGGSRMDSGLHGVVHSDDEADALRDPDNLLKPYPRKLAKASRIVSGGTLRLKTGSDPRGLNQYIANGADVITYARYVGNRIATRQIDFPDSYSPELAVKVVTPDEGLTYQVTLRKGVYWHKPVVDWDSGRYDWLKERHELTSDDFKFVFEMLGNPQVAGRISSLRNYFEALDRFEVVDRYTFKVIYKERQFSNLSNVLDLEPSPRWLYMYDEDGTKFDEATWGLKVNEHWYNQKMVGTGPYKFVAWEPGVKLEFERNDDYWGETPTFERVMIFVVKDQNAWPRKLKTLELDYTQLQPEQYRTEIVEGKGPILGKKGIQLAEQDSLSYFYLGWNHDSPYFNTKEARQAMTLALNRKAIIKNVFAGLGTLTTGPFPQQNDCYDDSIEPYPFDLELAGKKLDEAGWKDTDDDGIRDKVIDGKKIPFEFSMLLYGSSSEYQTMANIFREDLLQIGVKLNPRAVEWSTMLKKMDEREFDGYSGGWVLDWDTDLMQIWHSSEADKAKSSNRIGFRNKEADEIAEALRREFNPKKRTELCHRFHALVHDEQPYSFIYQRKRPVLYWDHMNALEFSLVYPNQDIRHFSFREERP